jgi:hypothetical protein
MKKLLQLTLTLFLVAGALFAQSSKPSSSKAYAHLAQFSVFDYTTKAPIERAVVMDKTGFELGHTNANGMLALHLPPSTADFYTIRADGFNPMTIRLTQADKKSGEYEVFLPATEIGYSRAEASLSNTPDLSENDEIVKVYVKENPATYQRKTSQGNEITFSVQVSASSKPVSEKNAKKDWQDIGQVYIHQENGMYKVRIGPYATQQEAKQALLQVKSKGRSDAFIVVMQSGQFDAPSPKEEIRPTTPVVEENPATSSIEYGDYKVRVASYLHPGAFNPEGIDQLGRLESYRKGEWTIMMIGGFRTLEEARTARDIVMSKGFTDAAIVKDKDGIIETIEEK